MKSKRMIERMVMEMAKDPAVLFYYQDFLVGTNFMSDDELGKYIRILCHLADKQTLSEKQVLSICKASVIPESILGKLVKDENGNYFNLRMRDEQEKRKKFTESRRNNALGKKAHAEHMEDENDNTNEDVSFDLSGKFDVVWKLYPVRQGKKSAEKHFRSTVKTEKDFTDIQTALRNYLQCDKVKSGYIQNGSTWFNDWQSWIEPSNEMMRNNNGITSNGVRKSDQTARATYEKSAEQIAQDVRNTAESIRLLRRERS